MAFNENECGIEREIVESEGDKYLEVDLSSKDGPPAEPVPAEREPEEPASIERKFRRLEREREMLS